MIKKTKHTNSTLAQAQETPTEELLEETPQEETVQKETAQEQESPVDINKLIEEMKKWQDLALRSQAEMENLRKRTQIDIEKANRYAVSSFAKELLNVADCLNGAIDCAQKEITPLKEAQSDCVPFLENLLKGVEMTQKQLHTVFEHNHIQKIETLGKPFDPNTQKAIQEIPDETKESGTVLQELQTGYTIGGDRVLREAMVIVAQ